MEYIKAVDRKELYNDGIGFVELWDFSRANENEESRIEAVATVASICYGKSPKDAKKLVERLWTESGGLPSSAFEFIRSAVRPLQWSVSIKGSLRNQTDLRTNEEWCFVTGDYAEWLQKMHRGNIATFRLKVPIFIARQIMRHRSFSYQELSRRYAGEDVPFEFWGDAGGLSPAMGFYLKTIADQAMRAYVESCGLGERKEISRAVLPQSLYTEFWLMGEVGGLKNYFRLRLDAHTQKEHREVARALLDMIKEHQPELYERIT